jgi:bifunctional non-homologous end joining protein LigD
MPAGKTKKPATRAHPAPRFIEPMKPTLVESLPDGDEWAYEVKWDGYRALVLKHGDTVRLLSRNGKTLANDFPEIVETARHLTADTVMIDGEIVALDREGRPSFQALQNRASTNASIVFYAFDLLSLDGKEWIQRPLKVRQSALNDVVAGTDVRLSRRLPGNANEVVEAVSKLGLEGVVAKRLDSLYTPGRRSADWQKIRLRAGQEFVIGGYRPGMKPFESVLVGYYEKGKLMFAGKVRPGFTSRTRGEVWALIANEEIKTCPFTNLPDADKKGRWGEGITPEEMKTLRWVKPRHVVAIEFAEWTRHGHLRHATYRGIQPDKNPREVRRESVQHHDDEI